MKVYVVLFYVSYEGYCKDEKCKVFKDENEAKEYIEKLNEDFAKMCNCYVEELGDYYDYEEMDLI